MRFFLFLALSIFLSSCTTTYYYIVRHAERATASNMVTDVPLSEEGQQRAEALRGQLKNVGIRHIFSTNTLRTRSTAAPLGEYIGIPTDLYEPRDTNFVLRLKNIRENTLVVGHSNTVDDLVNGLTGKPLLQDLPDTQYGDLFIVIRKGKKFRLEKGRYGK